MTEELLDYSVEVYGESFTRDNTITLSQLISSHRYICKSYDALSKTIGEERKRAYKEAYAAHTDWLETTQAFTIERLRSITLSELAEYLKED
jgi:hypothetical protein